MKHLVSRNAILREHPFDALPPNPSSMKQNRSYRKQKSSKENAPPSDINALPDSSNFMSFAGKPSPSVTGKLKAPLPPRPPSSNPLKRKLGTEFHPENGVSGSSDTGVKVLVRIRPLSKNEEGEMIVQKTSGDSLSILGQQFTFDSVADASSTQMDIFQLVGAPLVENCLAGFNGSIFAYGQTGSGKTYTIWGPASTLLEEKSSSNEQGLTPRVFERLFTRIDEEQVKHADKQLMYQCRCSFLEIYNEQITDLLNPSQRNLHLREDTKTGVYVENLTEESIFNMKDVTQLLKKGLSNRRTGATSINLESSRSHSVFTCVVESRCKSVDGLSCFKTSRMNLVDLAGSERQKSTGAAGDRLKEAGNINRSLSQLGNLINILAEVSQTGKQRHIPYRDSKLTFLLQESLGGNAKLAMLCAISPSQSCRSETLSTLRFAKRAKVIRNKAVINEKMQDNVDTLREVIRQLKDELLRMKTAGSQADPSAGFSTGWNARRSLNLLRFSLNHPMILPHVDDDGDAEMEIVEEGDQVLLASNEENKKVDRKDSEDTDVNMEEDVSEQVGNFESNKERTRSPVSTTPELSNRALMENANGLGNSDIPNVTVVPSHVNMEEDISAQVGNLDETVVCSIETDKEMARSPVSTTSELSNHVSTKDAEGVGSDNIPNLNVEPSEVSPVLKSLTPSDHVLTKDAEGVDNGNIHTVTVQPSEVSPVLKSPTPSVSPIANSTSRKSLRTSSMLTASQKELRETTVSEGFENPCHKASKETSLTSRSAYVSRSCLPSDHLAASLHRGLEAIDKHHKSSALGRSSFRFSHKPIDSKPPLVRKDVGVQALLRSHELEEEKPVVFLCRNCNCTSTSEVKDGTDDLNLQLVPADNSQLADQSKQLVPKAVEKVLAGAIRREMALEELCTRQDSEISQLNRLLEQYKHERECNLIIGQIREDKIARLESLMDGVLSAEEFVSDELASLTYENKIMKENYENHPEVLRTEIEFKRVQDELERYQNFFDLGERDVLLEEIQDLRSQLKSYMDSSSQKRNPVLKLTHPSNPSADPSFESERLRWNEMESQWISITEDLKRELEASRLLVEKQKHELNTEKKCAKELKDAMQMAMEGHARMLEQYADLEEKHIHLLTTQRTIEDGIVDVKKAAAKAGVRGAESKFINALAAEISALKAEREKEKRHLMDENKGLRAQLRDTAEAVQAASELLVRLKEAEEAVAAAEARAKEAEQEKEKAYEQIESSKRKHEGELTELPEPSSWFSGYDKCNI